MNLTRIISIKERIAIDRQWKPDERDFILECINIAIASELAVHAERARCAQIAEAVDSGRGNEKIIIAAILEGKP